MSVKYFLRFSFFSFEGFVSTYSTSYEILFEFAYFYIFYILKDKQLSLSYSLVDLC